MFARAPRDRAPASHPFPPSPPTAMAASQQASDAYPTKSAPTWGWDAGVNGESARRAQSDPLPRPRCVRVLTDAAIAADPQRVLTDPRFFLPPELAALTQAAIKSNDALWTMRDLYELRDTEQICYRAYNLTVRVVKIIANAQVRPPSRCPPFFLYPRAHSDTFPRACTCL